MKVQLRTDRPCRSSLAGMLLAAMLSGSLIAVGPHVAKSQSISMDRLQKGLLSENWTEVAGLLDSVTYDPEKTRDPVLRWIKGVVTVPLNRNNESVSLLLSVADPEDVARCAKWADRFRHDHPGALIAGYLQGDILARDGNGPQALNRFDEVVRGLEERASSKGDSSLLATAHNARGVVYLRMGEFDDALLDFNAAARVAKGSLADAYANLGALQMERSGDPETAIEYFTDAIALANENDFPLAYYGRGCCRMIRGRRKGESEEGFKKAVEEDLQKALRQGGLATPLMLRAMPATTGQEDKGLAVAEGAGSSFRQDFQSMQPRIDKNWMPGGLSSDLADLGRRYNGLSPSQRAEAFRGLDLSPKNLAAKNRILAESQKLDTLAQKNWSAGLGVKGFEATFSKSDTLRGTSPQRTLVPDTGGIVVTFHGSKEDWGDWPFVAFLGAMY